ncbi:MAG: hypothetical protein V1867_04885 [Candidatus Falkowbacteria bacterium]
MQKPKISHIIGFAIFIFLLSQPVQASTDSSDGIRKIESALAGENYGICQEYLNVDKNLYGICQSKLKKKAEDEKKPDLCALLDDKLQVPNCIYEIKKAGGFSGANDCLKIKDSTSRLECQRLFDIDASKVYRDEIMGESPLTYDQNDYKEYIAACSFLPRAEARSDCYFRLALKTKEFRFCEKAFSEPIKESRRSFEGHVYFGISMTDEEACGLYTSKKLNFNNLAKLYYPIVLLILTGLGLIAYVFRIVVNNRLIKDLVYGALITITTFGLLVMPYRAANSNVYTYFKFFLEDTYVVKHFFLLGFLPGAVLGWLIMWWPFLFAFYVLFMFCWRRNKLYLILYFAALFVLTEIRILLNIANLQN